MQANGFQSVDLFAQVQGLVDGLEAERAARAAAEGADAAKSDLFSLMGRELRTPMAAVVATTERLLAGHLDATQRRDAEVLAKSAQTLLGTLNEVLDFVALEDGEAELATERFDLHALVKDAASRLQAEASAKGITSGVDMAADCPRFIVGDEGRVRQVVMDLIEAALRATSEGSIRLYVTVNDAEMPYTVRFDITDTGEGLSEAQRESLFRPSTDTSSVGGRLGLPIARRLAEAMGGELGCDSALGQGTLYWFTFRTVVAEDEDEAPQPAVVEAEPASAPKTQAAPKGALSGHVLLVEGNVVNRLLIAAYLQEFGLTHEVAENGTAALMCLAARGYDLVLTDTVLPDYNGVQIAKRIRALQGASSQVPIVGLAAHSETDDDVDYVAAGMNARVVKPIQGRALYAALVPFLPARAAGETLAKAS